MRFDCVFFDSGGTLFGAAGGQDPTPEQVRDRRIDRVAALMSAFQIDVDPEALAAAIVDREQWCPEQFGAGYNFLRLMEAVLRELGLTQRSDVAACLADAYAGPRYASWLFPGTRQVLARLAGAGASLGLIANTAWCGFSMDRALAGVGLLDLLKTRVVSGDVGIAKPDERIFRLAEELAGAAGKRILYVGNDVEADIRGAAGAGWSTALKTTTCSTSGGLADFEFDEMPELLELLL